MITYLLGKQKDVLQHNILFALGSTGLEGRISGIVRLIQVRIRL